MKNEWDSMYPEKIIEKNGITFFRIKSEKFKTNSLDIFFVTQLKERKATCNALAAYILKRGSGNYPTQRDLALKLEEMYGSGMNISVQKKGENQLIHFNIGFVSDRFTTDKTRLFDEAGNLLLEVLTNPILEDGKFKREYYEQERENLIQRIRSRVNNKMSYAMHRCLEEMCKGEPYAIYEDGSEEEVKEITVEEIMSGYNELLKTYPAFVYVSGNFSDEELHKLIDKFDIIERQDIQPLLNPDVRKRKAEPLRVEEPMDVSQGKLCLGFRTQIPADSPDYYPLAVYNGILGGGVQSKLFQNVREKESLAYSTFSLLEKYKGLLVACCGIEISNREKAEKIMLDQFRAIENGDITDDEMEATKKSFETGLKSMQDSQGAMVDFYLSQYLSGVNENLNEFLNKLMSVSKEDIIRVSRMISPDTVYFLTSLKESDTERSAEANENNGI